MECFSRSKHERDSANIRVGERLQGLYQEVKHCWSVKTQSSLIREPPHTCTSLQHNVTIRAKAQVRIFLRTTTRNLLPLDANNPAAVCAQHSVTPDDPGVDVHKARDLGSTRI